MCYIKNLGVKNAWYQIKRYSSIKRGIIYAKKREKIEENIYFNNNCCYSGNDSTIIQTNRGVKKGTSEDSQTDYYVNKYTNMPSCLIELGFISNKTDNKFLDKNIDEYADAIVKGIMLNLK